MKLRRCTGCDLAMYCVRIATCCSHIGTHHDMPMQSKACQDEHWQREHKFACPYHAEFRDTAIALSGNPQAWSHLSHWAEFHNTSLMNAATALYLRKKARVSGDVTADYFFHVLLQYLNDPNLPVERQFKLVHG